MSSLKQYVIATVSAETYYQKRFTAWNPRNRPNVICPWHDDKKPSLSLNLHNGGARCHACEEGRVGNIVHFESKLLDISEDSAAGKLYSEFIRPIVPDAILASLQKALAADRKIRKIIEADCGITPKGIELFALGWDARSRRLAIPIFDRWEQVINLRLYRPPRFRSKADEAFKVLNLVTSSNTPKEIRYGGNTLFSWPHFEEFTLDAPVFVMPSEKEMILGMQEGLQCVCATAGEQSWEESWKEYFVGYDICVVAQRDTTGRSAANKKLASLQTVASYACIIEPPTQLKDFADFVVEEAGTGAALLAAFDAKRRPANSSREKNKVARRKTLDVDTKDFLTRGKKKKSLLSDDSSPALPGKFSDQLVKLVDVGHAPEMLNQIIRTTGIVAAKSTRTYSIPWRFKIKIKGDAQRYYSVPMGRTLLSFIGASDGRIREVVRELLDNDKASVETESFITAAEVEVIPTAAVDEDVPYVTQRCYFIGARIEANIPYELEIIPTTASQTQETIGIIVKATPIARALENATFTVAELATLQTFRPAEKETVWDKMMEQAEALSRHYTKIYNRPDWHLVALLTWLSPIGWMFPYEKETQRGWLNSLVLGDTQTGKSKVVQTYQRLFRVGAVVNAENCTYVGLVGGAIKMGSGQFMLRWGRIPLADKQLVVIEELSGLSVEEISNMSDVRSSGIARLDKGGLSAETNARTRLLALSNVRPVNKNLAGYLSGVKAIQELVGHGEDIARFDLISTLVDREVSNEVINRPFSADGDKDATPAETYQRLCQFVWALKPDQVKITTDAYLACLEETKRLADIYHPAIPVFKGGSGRYKIARVAAAIACLQFSWTGKAILVLEDHVYAASQFLEMLYNKSSFGYDEWSRQMFDRDGVKDIEALDNALRVAIRNAKTRGKVMESLVHTAKFSRDEMCAVASLQITQADALIGVMVRERVLRKGEANVWEITPAGRDWMLTHLNDNPLGTNGKSGHSKHDWFNKA